MPRLPPHYDRINNLIAICLSRSRCLTDRYADSLAIGRAKATKRKQTNKKMRAVEEDRREKMEKEMEKDNVIY